MKRYNLKYACALLAGILLSMLNFSCQDDELYGVSGKVIAKGEPATVKLKVKLSDMPELSRSLIDDETASKYCENLWIGIYDNDGKRIYRELITDVAETFEVEDDYNEFTLNIKTTSTPSAKIVAVANVDSGEGLASIDDDIDEACSMRTLLEAADTFDKYSKICAMRPDVNDVNIYTNTFMMSGVFYEYCDYGVLGLSKLQPIDIAPGDNDLTENYGAIYLQRVIAYNKFIITPDENIDLTLNTWQVCNIPAGSYLNESSTNACDDYKGDSKVYNNSKLSHVFTTTGDTDDSKYFEFFQMENKHDACSFSGTKNADDTYADYVGIRNDDGLTAKDWYADREREYKDDDENTGIYKSLVDNRNDAKSLANNNASYVVINATVEYYIADTPENRKNPDEADPVARDYEGNKIHRTANVNYTIHLGYCEGKKSTSTVARYATATDFNCRRNYKYTYNVKIKGVKNLVVEARNENLEPDPSTDGVVVDAYTDVSHLDSHYCTFNVKFSNKERQTLGFRMFSPYNGKTYMYYRNWDAAGTVIKSNDLTDKMLGNIGGRTAEHEGLFEWIKFKPILDSDGDPETYLADYGDGTGLWTLEDLCAPDAHPHPDCDDVDDETERYYTVFVDEYVYHFDDEGDVETSWPNYVNQDDRCVEIISNGSISKDRETSYSFCKYIFEQKSIQTYFNSNVTRAVGVEHEDETYCLNLRWDVLQEVNKKDTRTLYDYNNGLYNIYYYLTTRSLTWPDVVDKNLRDYVIGGTTSTKCTHPDATYTVCSPTDISSQATALANKPSPTDSRLFYANSICMNRNRDLNGDNEISVDEMRWYMPPTNVYIQIGIGQAELPDPLIKFNNFVQDAFTTIGATADRDGKYLYHLVTSDYQYLFSEECISNGDGPLDLNNQTVCQTYGVRCVRNLGTNVKTTPVKGDNPVPAAYTHDATARTFTQDKFTDISLRGYNNSALAPHTIADPTSRPYYKFEYAQNFCVGITDDYGLIKTNSSGLVTFIGESGSTTPELQHSRLLIWTRSLKLNSICGKYTQETDKSDLGTWRVPNFKEIALMYLEGLCVSGKAPMYSCTYSYFDDYYFGDKTVYTEYRGKYFGYYDNGGDRKVLAMDVLSQTPKIRCVRDVKVEGK